MEETQERAEARHQAFGRGDAAAVGLGEDERLNLGCLKPSEVVEFDGAHAAQKEPGRMQIVADGAGTETSLADEIHTEPLHELLTRSADWHGRLGHDATASQEVDQRRCSP